ncbi:MAG: sulfatase [Armatimonadota bacterium]
MATRRNFLKAASALAAAPLVARAQADQRPDVLFIAIEDVSPHRFGCYGNTVCRTPNIDRFASQGLRFDNAHTSPPCCPSRTALLLGLRPETTKVFGNQDDWHHTYPNALTIPVHFRNHGYETIRCGKMYHGKFEDDASWSRIIQPHEGMPERKNRRRPLQGPGEELAREIREGKRTGSPFLYGPTGLEDWEEKDGGVAEQGVRLLQQKSAKPRLMCLGFHATHLPFAAPDEYFEPYPAEKMVIPRNPDADETGMPKDPQRLAKHNPHTLEQWRAAIAAHYACTSFVDAQVGRVLQALEESGRADDTIVVIWSDHGFMLGEHFLWRKGPLYEESTRVLLLIRAPGLTTPGTACRRPVESIDIFPTLLELCGLPQPPNIEALSMRPLLQDPDHAWKKGALMWGGKGRHGIVTERWRYSEYQGDPQRAELFDHETDPGEFRNLAKDPEHGDVVAGLSRLLRSGWRACLPDSG